MKNILLGLLGVLLLAACNGGNGNFGGGNPPPGPPAPPPIPTPAVPIRVDVFVPNAAFPSAVAFAPDGRLFYAELTTGNVRVVQSGQLLAQPWANLPVNTNGEQGLLSIAFDPAFATNGFVYFFHTHPNPLRNRVVRFTDAANQGTNLSVIVDNLPATQFHNGGRIKFGADGLLYVTVGDSTNPANSQDASSVSGKVLRYTATGSIPPANPIGGNPMYALGLRNSFGIAFHSQTGVPYLSDNGPTCDDKLHRIVANGNYGWRPNYPCGDTSTQFIAPLVRFNPVIAPTGMTFYTGNVFPEWRNHLFLASFNDAALRRFVVDEQRSGLVLEQQSVLTGMASNYLDVAVGTDGNLYVATNNSILRIQRGP
jgi:glucose/arabinose dehydrogenase